VREPVGLLALEGAVAGVLAAAAKLGRYICAAWADLLKFVGWFCRRHDGGGEIVDVGVLLCWLSSGGGLEGCEFWRIAYGMANGGDNKRRPK